MASSNNTSSQDQAKPTLDQAIAQGLSAGKAGVKRKARFKAGLKLGGALLIGLFLLWAYDWLFALKKGGMGYGLCKVFLELQVQYPPEMRISYTRPMRQTIRIWYVTHDSYGQTAFDMMDCKFKQDPQRGVILDKVMVNRRQMEPGVIEKFNKSIPAIYAYPPDLTYPRGLPDNLKKLKLEK